MCSVPTHLDSIGSTWARWLASCAFLAMNCTVVHAGKRAGSSSMCCCCCWQLLGLKRKLSALRWHSARSCLQDSATLGSEPCAPSFGTRWLSHMVSLHCASADSSWDGAFACAGTARLLWPLMLSCWQRNGCCMCQGCRSCSQHNA
jgi:hypothetical protein